MKIDGYISLRQAANMVSVSPTTIYRAVDHGELRWERISGHKVTKAEWANEYMQQKQKPSVRRKRVGFSCTFEADQWRRMQDLSKNKNITMSALIREAVENYIAMEGEQNE